jgi:ABC-type arginine/histidine transport system permease subunit
MATDEEINNALLAIHSRLGVIEGKVNLVARAHKQSSLEDIEAAVRGTPLLGQIYLLLDGLKTQTEIHEKLAEFGIVTSAMSVSRAMKKLETEYGMVDLIKGGSSRVFRKDAEAEGVLNLSANIRKWLAAVNATVPEGAQRRRRKKTA